MSEKPKCYSKSHQERHWIVCDVGCYPTACRMPFVMYREWHPEEAKEMRDLTTHVCEHCGHIQKRKWSGGTRSACSKCGKEFHWEE